MRKWLCKHGWHAWELYARAWYRPHEKCRWCGEVREVA